MCENIFFMNCDLKDLASAIRYPFIHIVTVSVWYHRIILLWAINMQENGLSVQLLDCSPERSCGLGIRFIQEQSQRLRHSRQCFLALQPSDLLAHVRR